MKLYDVPRNQKFLIDTDDGKAEEFLFHHIDGMYSLFTRVRDGKFLHLGATTKVKKVGEHYEIVDLSAQRCRIRKSPITGD